MSSRNHIIETRDVSFIVHSYHLVLNLLTVFLSIPIQTDSFQSNRAKLYAYLGGRINRKQVYILGLEEGKKQIKMRSLPQLAQGYHNLE